MNEATAIRLCLREHDPRGFEFLVREYRREAYFHALGFMGDRAAAEDACQESFTKAYLHLPRLKTLTAFYPWFYTILKNTCLNQLRARRETRELPEIPDETGDPEGVIQGDHTSRTVWEVLMGLKDEFREILVLKHLQDRSYHEISEVLGIPRGTVMSRLYHARRAFQQQYRQHTTEINNE